MSNKPIESFQVDHNDLPKGVYLSRVDELGDRKIYTYDLRMTEPNKEKILTHSGVHTLEHNGATYFRNDAMYGEDVIYFGAMGCFTGYYLILKDTVPKNEVLPLIKRVFNLLADETNNTVHGGTQAQCGSFSDHSPFWQHMYAKEYLEVLNKLEDNHDFKYPKFIEEY